MPSQKVGMACQGNDRRDVVDGAIALDGGQDAGRDGQAQRQEQARPRELEGCGQPLEHERHGGLPMAQGLAEVSAQRSLQEAQVLDGHGIVEAHGLAEAGDVLGGRIGREEERGRIAREMQDEKDHDGDAEENENGLPQAPQQVGLHVRVRSSLATASMWGVCGNMSTGCTHSTR